MAHPDDEVLWFSSILDKINKVVLCFQLKKGNEKLGKNRETVIQKYPLDTILSLELYEANAYKEKHFIFPIPSKYGMILYNYKSHLRYKKNYHSLKQRLDTILSNQKTVFTHNPWGEYGNEEHVQIYRVVKELQKKYKYDLYFSNYVSTKSMKFAQKYIFKINYPYIVSKPNFQLTEKIKSLYQLNNCWTWTKDWTCYPEEIFLQDTIIHKNIHKYGHIVPLNLIKH